MPKRCQGSCRFGNNCGNQHIPPSLDTTSRQPSAMTKDRLNISSSLPTTISSGYIPLNKDNQRIDTYIRPPTREEWAIYHSRFHKQKPCNSFHLQRVCTTFGCPYDHNELEPESRLVMEYVIKCSPCPKKGDCQKDGCQGQMKGCRMKLDLHSVDPELANMVLADDDDEEEEEQKEHVHDQDQGMPVPDENGYLW
jgi:hypothetical protein